ncbi:energy transducer TonB [Paludibaculum fermentans]|uniref:energy transducer TonB n=1 Tax=Paludibaculum fermentans TaxID=1473598 RepID=UPI003EBB7114
MVQKIGIAGAATNEKKKGTYMFEQSFVEGTVKTNRGWPVVVSSCLQVTLITAGVIVPLMNPEMLPRNGILSTYLATPPLPPAPAPPAQPMVQTTARKTAPRQVREGQLIAYTRVPTKVNLIEDPPDLGQGPGVVGGIENGLPNSMGNSLINQLVNSSQKPVEPPPVVKPVVQQTKPPERIRVGSTVQEARIISRKIPEYPRLALQTRQQGTVTFTAIISRDGTIQHLQLISGHPLFVQAATEAVKQWRYRPTLLNGEPVEVVAPIEIKFILNN